MNSPTLQAAFLFLFAGSIVMIGCTGGDDQAAFESDTTVSDTTGMMGMDQQNRAVAQLAPTQGNQASGTVTFTSMNGGVQVEATVSGLQPGPHGFHVHENGDCSAPDASSAGDHFAPEGNPHAGPDDQPRHVGDLGNIEAGQDGSARYTRTDNVITLSGPNSIVGRAVVVHAGEDDLTTQPSGDSGNRVACGVVEMQTGGQMPGQMPGPVAPGTQTPGAQTPGTPTDTASAI